MDSREMMAELARSLVLVDTSPENMTISNNRCVCGAQLRMQWVDRAEFNGRVIQEAGSFPVAPKCDACLEKDRRGGLIVYDPVKENKRIELALTSVFDGEKPAREYTFDRFEQDLENSPAFLTLSEADATSSDWYLWGPCGVGKTHLSCAMIRKAHIEGRTVAAYRMPRLFRHMRVKDADEQERRLKHLSRVDVLLIDELGIGRETEFVLQILQELIDMRADHYRNGLIVTSNLSLADFAKKIGEDRIPSRMSSFRSIQISGRDRRISEKRS